jgi:hypothetical protein
MMLEQSLISPNFLGKESFRWFIGLVTQYVSVLDSSQDKVGSGFKAKVRIIGYHPDSNKVIPDDELPWAHVLVPLNMGTGTGGNVFYNVPKGGETVIGFFIDGDNGQQPVIIGALGSGYTIEHSNGWNEGTNGFKPFKKRTTSFNPNNKDLTGRSFNSNGSTKSPLVDNKVNSGIGSTAVFQTTQGAESVDLNRPGQEQILSVPPVCKNSNSTYSKIVQTLRKFIRVLNTYLQVQSGFIDPIFNKITDLPGLAQEAAIALSDLFSDYIKYMRDLVMKSLYSWLEGAINSILPKDIKILKQLAVDKVADSIWCAFSKVLKGIGEFVFNFLMQLAGAITNIPICAAEAFVGSIISTVTNEISDAIGPALSEFTSSLSGTIGEINNYVFQALNYANQALSFLDCESAECKTVYNYQMNKGYIPQETIENVQKILNYPTQTIQDGKQAAETWLGIVGAGSDQTSSYLSSSYGYCDAVNLDCGLPTIQFFGGGGSGATGLAVVDALGQLIGITVQNSGTGYSSPPYISVEDSCGNGNGASATAVIKDGKVVSVIVDTPGSGYLTPGGDPCSTNPIDQTGSEVIGTIVGVKVLTTGIGYQTTDLITDSVCSNSDIEIYPKVDLDGRIIDVTIVNPGSSVRTLPELIINTQSGEGAILQPILEFKPVEPVTGETDANKIKQVVLCAEDHV